MVNCIVVDDEQYSIETLTEYISKVNDFNLIATYTNPLNAIKDIYAGVVPEIIFLDIDMPELPGFELATLLPPEIAIIYITAHADYALQSFETNVYDFLLKPISFQKFIKSVNKIKLRLTPQLTTKTEKEDLIFINPGVKGKMIKLAFEDIIYIEGLKNYITIFTSDGKNITYLAMKEIEQVLPPNRFIRIHKSYIVNLNHIQSIEGNTVTISEHLNLPMGGNYKEAVLQIINKYAVVSKRKDV